MQSSAEPHDFPVAHLGHPLPPHPTSLSLPTLTGDAQFAAAQRPAVHMPLAQSGDCVQCFATTHGAQLPPPQSTSLSVPS